MLSAVIKTPQRMPDMSPEAEKIELRKSLKKQRNALSPEQAAYSSLQASRHILACDAYRKARCIMGFLAFGRELSVDEVLRQALADGKQVAVPFIISATEFVPALIQNLDDFVLDRYGIRTVRQPLVQVAPEGIDLVLVPGVAFGRDGSRMGMGAGYYDRFLTAVPGAVTMGVAYDGLLQEALPCDAHDVPMDYIVSESGILIPKPL